MSDRPTGSPSLPPMQDDGLPTLPTGEPVLARWFVVAMLVLVPAAVIVTAWAFLSIPRDELTAAERRPPGDEQVTIDRGRAEFGASSETEPGPPPCGEALELIGDDGTRAASRGAMAATCELLASDDFPEALEGLRTWIRADGLLRIATFQRSGVESSARLEDDRLVVELNAKFQFEDAARAAPALLHQLRLLAEPSWPGEPLSAAAELAAAEDQLEACRRLSGPDPVPRGCDDVEELLAEPDPLASLVEAGWPAG
jgi:hypothetical protein